MKEKTKLRIIQILCIVSLLITVFSIQRTYAKYFEKVGTTYDTKIKRWLIDVNNSIIHDEKTLSNIMQPIFNENENMNNNDTLVPGREGYFPFLINYEKVDLAFQFGFNLTQTNAEPLKPLEDFEIYGYEIVDGENKKLIEGITDLSDINPVIDPIEEVVKNPIDDSIIDLNPNNTDTKKEVEIRVLFRWNDENADTEDEESVDGMNNFEDTQFLGADPGEENGDKLHKLLKYNISVTFIQYVGQSKS